MSLSAFGVEHGDIGKAFGGSFKAGKLPALLRKRPPKGDFSGNTGMTVNNKVAAGAVGTAVGFSAGGTAATYARAKTQR